MFVGLSLGSADLFKAPSARHCLFASPSIFDKGKMVKGSFLLYHAQKIELISGLVAENLNAMMRKS
jgi:hypothetical protein